ncbi:MAG: response regulator [Bacteroidota bacterium]|nr:response regulator [Bacteroidota bacterium]MDX5431597.1 response regulator [Bacteroidota bacterium]MDX5470318.1 response regulator [Bacteroidota bacterium]
MKTDDYEVFCANNRQVALDFVLKHIPDFIISDVLMPEMNGYEWITKLHELPLYKQIPLIFLTSLDSPDERIKGLSHGAVDSIAKPFTGKELSLKVKHLLRLNPN